jgi:uncharacterized protein with NRDE domain
MCIAYLAFGAHPDWPLFIAANRDEYHQRPSLAAAPWRDHPDIIGGVDCQAGGTWLGLTRQGRFALLTNYRDPATFLAEAPSRGMLVSDYLIDNILPDDYAQTIHRTAQAYNGFNLLLGDLTAVRYVSNRAQQNSPQCLAPGRYILSNHLLNTGWPKAERLRAALDQFPMAQLDQSLSPVFEILKDNTQATDQFLPSTGLTLERERLLSSPFIISPEYGTRCSTVIAVHASGHAIFSETSYNSSGTATERHDWPFSISAE